ncbi:hypothetical protein V2J09_000091, partial [Rumex salicifolius]
SSFLKHKRLGHIFRERINLLVKEEILPSLDFTDFNICADCIKGKQTKHTKKAATRCSELFEKTFNLMFHLLVEKNMSLPLLMIIHINVIFTFCMTNFNLLML